MLLKLLLQTLYLSFIIQFCLGYLANQLLVSIKLLPQQFLEFILTFFIVTIFLWEIHEFWSHSIYHDHHLYFMLRHLIQEPHNLRSQNQICSIRTVHQIKGRGSRYDLQQELIVYPYDPTTTSLKCLFMNKVLGMLYSNRCQTPHPLQYDTYLLNSIEIPFTLKNN